MLRRIPFEKIENFRDIGGYAARYGETQYGVVYRSGYLGDATSKDLDTLVHLGVKTIIDLRNADDKKRTPDKTLSDSRFTNLSFPVNGDGRVPKNRVDMIASYLEILEDPQKARAVFLALAHCEKPCVLHCTAGKDRTGCFVAVLLLANGVPFHDVNADYMLSFPYLTRLCRLTKEKYPDFPKAVLTPDTFFLKKVMDRFKKRWGSVDEYFETIGISEDDRSLLDNLLGKQEKSCGAVVFHDGKILVEHMAKGHYSIPKGHVESFDKSDRETVLREIKEETGLDARIISDETHRIEYSPEEGISKKVVFFIATSEMTETTPQPKEIRECFWLSPDDAVRVMTYESDKKTIIWACNLKSQIEKPSD